MKKHSIPIGIKINNEIFSFSSNVWISIVGKFREKSQWYTNGKEDVFCIEQPKGFKIGKSNRENQIADFIEQDNEINAVQISNVCLDGEEYFEECESPF
jgi:hypothetical protein